VPLAAWLWYCANLYSAARALRTIRAAAPANIDRRVQPLRILDPSVPLPSRLGGVVEGL
jgi:hypothetical protein